MTQPTPIPPTPAPPPRAPILSYLTAGGALTPTRVRRLASWLVAVLGAALFIAGAWLWINTVLEKVDWIRYLNPWFDWWWPLRRWRSFRDGEFSLQFFIGALALLCGVALLLAVRPVRRGHAQASRAAAFILLLVILLVAFLTALAGGAALLELIYPLRNYPHPSRILWFLAVPPGILLILLLKDAHACLRWIVHNPTAEKPPVKFLP